MPSVVLPPVLAGLLLALQLTQPNAAPVSDWRTLPLDSYPVEARTQIAAARDAALGPTADADAFGRLGLVLHAWEQYEAAARAYEDAQRRAPDDVTWWALAGTLATRMGRHEVAATCYGRAVALAPSPLLRLRHADALLESGQLDAARAAYLQAVALPDAEPAARYGLGRLAVASGQYAEARTEFERAIALVPTFGAAHYALAQVQRRAGDLAAARASIARQQACLACWPMPPDPFAARLAGVRQDAAALLQQGLQSADQADHAQAIALHESALAKDRTLLQAHVNLIALYGRTGNLARAEDHYRAVLASGTQLAEAHHAWGLALLSAKDTARAEPVLLQAVEGNPQDAEAWNALGLIRETTGRLPAALEAYTQAVAASPRQRAIRFNQARVLVNLGRLDDAIATLTPLTAQDDVEGARYAFALGAVLVRKGDVAAGRRWSEEALARARRHAMADFATTVERELAKLK